MTSKVLRTTLLRSGRHHLPPKRKNRTAANRKSEAAVSCAVPQSSPSALQSPAECVRRPLWQQCVGLSSTLCGDNPANRVQSLTRHDPWIDSVVNHGPTHLLAHCTCTASTPRKSKRPSSNATDNRLWSATHKRENELVNKLSNVERQLKDAKDEIRLLTRLQRRQEKELTKATGR
jgi:hypothetical protein